jgi:DNA-binding NtrC family response regulator
VRAHSTLVPANGCPPIVGTSAALRRAVALAERFAKSGLPILIVGATGTGKELLAQHVHHWSGRRGPLVDVNCAGLPRDLTDAWLFGHRRNAFTGAGEASPGLIEAAANGTLFLDEICSLPLEAQAKLLRVLETGEVRRVMDVAKRAVRFGMIAAAQEGLSRAIDSGAFRRDLFQRIAGVVIHLPPLSERTEDLMLLAAHLAAARGRSLSPGTGAVLLEYAWPGNVRELSAALDRATMLSPGNDIGPAALAEGIALGAPSADLGAQPRRVIPERSCLLHALEVSGWHAGRAAVALGIHRATLFRRARRLGISLRAPGRPESQSRT